MIKKFLLTIVLVFAVSSLMADPPKPPLGKRWVLNLSYSDEFNGTELDLSKWYNYHPTWKGRPPGLFMPSQVSMANGYLALRGEKMDRDTVIYNWDGTTSTFNVASGIIVSRAQTAFFGYYECRFKAAKTTMSSTFWFSTRQSFAGPAACADKYGLEWDIQECIGREGDFSGSDFARGMHSNAHFWYTGCDGEKQDIRAPQVRFEMEELPSENFNTYGGWWINENTASYYLNDGEPKSHRFDTSIKAKPFDRPMGMNLASETYPYPWVSLPTDEELADTSKNVCLYDWVRAYTLVDVDAPAEEGEQLLNNPDFEAGNLSNWIVVAGNPAELISNQAFAGSYSLHLGGAGSVEQEINLRAYSTYYLSCYGKNIKGSGPLILGIKDNSGNILGSAQIPNSSYERITLQFTTGSSGIKHRVFISAPSYGDEGYADNFQLILSNPSGEEAEETPMFHEQIEIDDPDAEKTAASSLDFLISYMARADREINLRLFNPDQLLMGEQKYLALAGYASKKFIMYLDSIPAGGTAYTLLADIRYLDSTLADTFQTVSYVFDILEPVLLDLTLMDLRDSTANEGAMVSIGDSVKTSDSDGRVRFYNLEVGSLEMSIKMPGFMDYQSSEIVLSQDTSLNIYLTPLTHSLSMYLTNSRTGKPLSGADIHINETAYLSDFNGGLTEQIYEGEYQVKISHPRYKSEEFSLNISRDTIVYIALKQTLADVKFVLKLDKQSLAGAEIIIGDQSQLTSTIGMANFPDLRTDSVYGYQIKHESVLLAEESVSFQTDTTLRLYLTGGLSSNAPLQKESYLYPNPAMDYILVSGLKANQYFTMSDLNGRLVLEGIVKEDARIDVSALDNGIYFFKASDGPPMKFAIYK